MAKNNYKFTVSCHSLDGIKNAWYAKKAQEDAERAAKIAAKKKADFEQLKIENALVRAEAKKHNEALDARRATLAPTQTEIFARRNSAESLIADLIEEIIYKDLSKPVSKENKKLSLKVTVEQLEDDLLEFNFNGHFYDVYKTSLNDDTATILTQEFVKMGALQ